MSEIDDIFAAKQISIPVSSSPPKKKKTAAKRKRDADDEPRPAKRRVPETVLDPSVNPQPGPSKVAATKSNKAAKLRPAMKQRKKVDKADEARFKDSRGNGPRRKTEEGFAIFKEDELGISNQGGDTPLCPFDCDCCF